MDCRRSGPLLFHLADGLRVTRSRIRGPQQILDGIIGFRLGTKLQNIYFALRWKDRIFGEVCNP
jgi:hypothetical protein